MPPWTFLHYLLGHMQGFFWGVNLRVEFLGPGASLFFHITRYRTVVSKASEPMTLPRRHILSLLRHDWFGAVVNKFGDLKLHPFALNSILVSSFSAIDPQSFPHPSFALFIPHTKISLPELGPWLSRKRYCLQHGFPRTLFFQETSSLSFPPWHLQKGWALLKGTQLTHTFYSFRKTACLAFFSFIPESWCNELRQVKHI